MTGTAALKAPGEKLIRIRLSLKTGEVLDAAISGDFFIHPEESVGMLEEALRGPLGGPGVVAERLRRAAEAGGIELVGVSVESIARCALEAAASCADREDG